MSDNNIIKLDEVSPNYWVAKYRGNYGVYTIEIKTDGKKTTKFSCSCPSDYYHCKHIAMIESAIAKQIATNKKKSQNGKQDHFSQAKNLLKKASRKELYNFIVSQARSNKKLNDAILIQFANKASSSDISNPYSTIIRDTLNSVHVGQAEDYYDYGYDYGYDENNINLEPLDPILTTLKKLVEEKNYRDAILLCKAYIEEFAEWFRKIDKKFNQFIDDVIDLIFSEYYENPFRTLGDIVNVENSGVDLQELCDYCKNEIKNNKYKEPALFNEFNNLFMQVASKVNPDEFIKFQDELLSKVKDKDSDELEIILKRKIALYDHIDQPQKSLDIIETNLHIVSFRKKLVEKKIIEKKYAEAKKLINDVVQKNPNSDYFYEIDWRKLLLEIAQAEKDTPTIRKIAFTYIKLQFDTANFKIYKSTFSSKEWQTEFENLLTNYKKHIKNSNNAFNLLAAENKTEQLIELVEKHLTENLIYEYYKHFAAQFPAKTLLLFRKALDKYVKDNVGRSFYEYLAKQLKKMQKINGGNKVVQDMVEQYRILYKNRAALKDVLKQF